MGNCQAAEAATVVIQHPGGSKVERFYWAVTAKEVMSSNPGYYVALVIASPVVINGSHAGVKQLKLLRPDDTLNLGQVYRLVCFQDVLKEFAAKKCVKLGKLLKERAGDFNNIESNKNHNRTSSSNSTNGGSSSKTENQKGVHQRLGSSGGRGVGRQWRPALQSIAELGT